MTRVVILHGWQNRRPADHWEHWLHDRLVERGIAVDYPQLPDPDAPDLGTWLADLSALVDGDGDDVTCVAHSLAASLWLTRLARGAGPGRVTRLALVAPPAPAVLRDEVVAAFADHPAVIPSIPGVEVRVFEGAGDPYLPGGLAAAYSVDAAVPVEVVAGGGHLVPDSGFGPWPRMLDWVLASRERVAS